MPQVLLQQCVCPLCQTICLRMICLRKVKSKLRNSNNTVQNLPVNHMSRSLMVSSSNPQYLACLKNKDAASSMGHAWDVGMNTAYFEKRSTTTIIDLHPSTLRNGMMKSIDRFYHGLSKIDNGLKKAILLPFLCLILLAHKKSFDIGLYIFFHLWLEITPCQKSISSLLTW